MYDFIGDIHGHADQLITLLKKLGYRLQAGVYRHPERKVFFVGDYIDRGPQILETLQIVKAMVDADAAIAVVPCADEHLVAAAALGDVLGHLAVLAPAALHCKLTAFGKMTLKLYHHCRPLGMSVPSCCLMPLKLHHLHCSESP
mgnify:CR=1 FL=1